ncbi:MAG: MFS transporter [Planctomycetota bacterium]
MTDAPPAPAPAPAPAPESESDSAGQSASGSSDTPAGTAAAAPVKTPIDKKARRALMTIFLIVLTDLIGFGMIIPLLPFYAKSLGASVVTVGMLFGIFSLFQFIFTPIWGRLSDRIGRKPVLMISLLVSVAMYGLYGWAGSLFWLFVARGGAGIGTANIGTAQAYIADILPPDRRAVGMGVLGAGFGLGFIFGPALGGILTWMFTPSAPGYAAAALSAVALVMTLTMLHEAEDRKPVRGGLNAWGVLKKNLAHPSIRAGWSIIALDIFSFSLMEVTLSLWLIDVMQPLPFSHSDAFRWVQTHMQGLLSGLSHGKENVDPDAALTIGLGMALVGFVMAFIQGGLIRRLVPKYGERKMLCFGLWSFGLGLILLPFLGFSYWLLLIPVFMQVIGQSLIQPSNLGLISRNADPGEQGAVMGIGQSISSLMRALGPVAATGLIAAFKPTRLHDTLPFLNPANLAHPTFGNTLHITLAYGVPYLSAGVLVLLALIPLRRIEVPPLRPGQTLAVH